MKPEPVKPRNLIFKSLHQLFQFLTRRKLQDLTDLETGFSLILMTSLAQLMELKSLCWTYMCVCA